MENLYCQILEGAGPAFQMALFSGHVHKPFVDDRNFGAALLIFERDRDQAFRLIGLFPFLGENQFLVRDDFLVGAKGGEGFISAFILHRNEVFSADSGIGLHLRHNKFLRTKPFFHEFRPYPGFKDFFAFGLDDAGYFEAGFG